MTSVPEGSTMILLVWSAVPSGLPPFSQRMAGLGLPEAWHGSTAIVFTGSVWLAGPIAMMGGGWSSRAVT